MCQVCQLSRLHVLKNLHYRCISNSAIGVCFGVMNAYAAVIVMRAFPISCQVLNLRGGMQSATPNLGSVLISTICASHNLLAAGGFHGDSKLPCFGPPFPKIIGLYSLAW